MGLSFNIILLPLLAGLLAVAWFAYRRTTPAITGGYRAALLALRAAVFIAIVFLLMDPRWIHRSTRSEPATAIVLIDRSASMSLPLVRGAGESRFDAAARLARDIERVVTSRGGRYSEAHFSADLLSAAGDTARADGQGTDIERSLASLQRKYEGENLTAVFLVSDGVDTEERLLRGTSLTVPVYAVGVGDTTDAEDVRIDDVEYNSIVRSPSKTTISAHLSHTGTGGKSVRLRLTEGNRTVFSRDTLLTVQQRDVTMDIPVEFPEPGRRSFTLEAVVSGDDEEPENNRRDIVIQAEKAGVRVLIVDLTPTWELHFLTEFLRNDDTFDFDLMAPLHGTPGSRKTRVKPVEEFADNLGEYDALVLASVGERFVDDRVAAAIRKFVVDDGKGLLVMPGPSSLFEHGAAWNELSDILPVRGAVPSRFRLEFTQLRPGAQAGANPITSQLVPILSQTEWQQRSPLLGYYAPLTAKAGVEVLLETDATPAFVYHAAGKGRVATLSAGPLWRWRFLAEGNTLYDEMISRALDVLSRGEATERFLLTSRKNVYDSGEEALITAEIFNEKMQPVTGVPVKIEITRIGESGAEVPLDIVTMKREGSDNPRFRATLPPLPPGTYRITGAAELPERTINPQPIEISVSDVSVEFQKVSQDRTNLMRIAGQSGGVYAAPGVAADLARNVDLTPRVVDSTLELTLRTSVWVFGLILLLLGAEWVLRKRAGMI